MIPLLCFYTGRLFKQQIVMEETGKLLADNPGVLIAFATIVFLIGGAFLNVYNNKKN